LSGLASELRTFSISSPGASLLHAQPLLWSCTSAAAAYRDQPALLAADSHIAAELVTPVRFERHGRAAVPPVLGVEVLGLGDVAGECHELDAGAAEPGRDRQRRRRDRRAGAVRVRSRSCSSWAGYCSTGRASTVCARPTASAPPAAGPERRSRQTRLLNDSVLSWSSIDG